MRQLSKMVWEHDADWFGGFSGIEVSPDGTTLTVLSDRGTLVHAQLSRTDGIIDSIDIAAHQTLSRTDGKQLPHMARDSEGLAILPDGTAFVSLESDHRVAALDLKAARLTDLAKYPDFAGFELNRGLEALAAHPDGTLFTLSEGGAKDSDTYPIYALRQGSWQITHRIAPSWPFQPVGADFDDQGRLYLLERTISPLGFRSQIRRVNLWSDPPTAETLFTSFPAAFDNLEGLAVWTDDTGITRLILVSDDNFLSLQTTQIVEFAVTR